MLILGKEKVSHFFNFIFSFSNQSQDQFATHPVLPYLEWLYTHRGSELFLMTWKRIGTATPPPPPPSTPAAAEPVPAAEPSTEPRPIPIPPPLPNLNRRIPRAPTSPPLGALLAPNLVRGGEDDVEVDTTKPRLTLEGDVVRWLIGKMAETWTEFFEQIDNKSMLFPKLTLFFGPIHRKQIPQEMELLVLTSKSGYNEAWIRVRKIILMK
jgi:hypothetical protein